MMCQERQFGAAKIAVAQVLFDGGLCFSREVLTAI